MRYAPTGLAWAAGVFGYSGHSTPTLGSLSHVGSRSSPVGAYRIRPVARRRRLIGSTEAIMDNMERKPLDYYLGLDYSFHAVADEEGGWTIIFPDLPGCLTMVDTLDELPFMVEDVRRLWIETEYEDGADIPLPSYPEEYSGKFNLRLPRSLHHRLADSAERDGVSLNQYVVGLL